MDARSITAWCPHTIPSPPHSTAPLQPLRWTDSCTILRLLRDHAEAEALAATAPSTDAASAYTVNAQRLPFPHPPPLLDVGCGTTPRSTLPNGSRAHEPASSSFPVPLHWPCEVLLVASAAEDTPDECSEPPAHHLPAPDAPPDPTCLSSGAERHRLRLGQLLSATAWTALFTRQGRTGSRVCSSVPDATALLAASPGEGNAAETMHGALREATAAADLEALAVLFPAVHHGHYFATPHAFAEHCLNSDDHLLWCEHDPLIVVDWEAAGTAEGGQRSQPASTATRGVAAGHEARSARRKRRRGWLAQHQRSTARGERDGVYRNDLSGPTHRTPRTDAREASRSTWSSTQGSEAVAMTQCAYQVGDVQQEHDASSSTADGTVCGCGPSSPSGAAVDNAFALWYDVLRGACGPLRSALLSHSADGGCPAAIDAAAVELLLHGIVTSLAWWLARCGDRLSSSVGENTKTLSALLCQWQAAFMREAAQVPSSAPLPAECPTRATVARVAGSVVASLCRRSLLPCQPTQPPVRADASGGSALPSAQGSGESWTVDLSSLLSQVAVSCGAVCTRYRRGCDRDSLWVGVAPDATDARASACEAATAAALPASDTWPTSVGDRFSSSEGSAGSTAWPSGLPTPVAASPSLSHAVRLSKEESDSMRDDYESAMELVLQLLFAEQRSMIQQSADSRRL